jgi:hypothetical protein
VIEPERVVERLRTAGWALVDAASTRAWLECVTPAKAGAQFEVSEMRPRPAPGRRDDALLESWNRLPPDRYLKDGGKYRFRRHASAIVDPRTGAIERVPHRPHWQPTTYNALHGGIRRWFEPIEDATWQHAAMQALIASLARVFAQAEAQPAERSLVGRWFVEAHQFRIDASVGIGKPTPEGAHRDGVDFVAVVLLNRTGIAGGESAVRALDGSLLAQTTLAAPFTALLMNDRRVMHETTPIVGTAPAAHRDTLVLTYRADGFMDPEEP